MKFSYKDYLKAEKKYDELKRKNYHGSLTDEEANEFYKAEKQLNKLKDAKDRWLDSGDEMLEEAGDSEPMDRLTLNEVIGRTVPAPGIRTVRFDDDMEATEPEIEEDDID